MRWRWQWFIWNKFDANDYSKNRFIRHMVMFDRGNHIIVFTVAWIIDKMRHLLLQKENGAV